MLKSIFFYVLLVMLFATNVHSQNENIIVDKDGRKIILYENKTWEYQKENEENKQSNKIETKLKSEVDNLFNKLIGKKPSQTETNNNNQNNGKSVINNNEIQEFLKLHNDERKKLGIEPLEWDEELTKQCEIYANKLIKIGTLMHDNLNGVGENLFWGSSSSPNQYKLKNGALSWLVEKQYFKSNKYTPQTGHYTQMIWRNTKKVGAFIIYNGTECYIVARYYPAGNYLNEKVY